jgi:superfamily II DNA/RNA helicase
VKVLQRLYAIKSMAVYGGQEKSQQLDLIEGIGGCPSIVVATPGRLLDLVARKEIMLDTVTYLVLDEADRMLALGFADQLDAIAGQIRPDRQAMMFTATFPGRLRDSCTRWLGDPDSCVSIRCGTLDIQQSQTPQQQQMLQQQQQQQQQQQLLQQKEQKKEQKESKAEERSSHAEVTVTKDSLGETDPESAAIASSETAASSSSALSSLALTINKSIQQSVHVCAEHKKPRLLIHYIERVRNAEKTEKVRQPGPMLVFCTKIKTVRFVYEFLVKQAAATATNKNSNNKNSNKNFDSKGDTSSKYRDTPSFGEKFGVGLLHGQLTQQDREKSMQLFKCVSSVHSLPLHN